MLLLATYRTEESGDALDALRALPSVQVESLDDLAAEDVAAIVGDMLAIRAPPARFVELLTAESGGNPFFVSEYIRAAAADGFLMPSASGQLNLTELGASFSDTQSALPMPGSLRELLERRLRSLTPTSRSVLDVASVLGREVEPELLDVEGPTDDLAMLEALQDLKRRGLLEPADPASYGTLAHHFSMAHVEAKSLQGPLHRCAMKRRRSAQIALFASGS